MIKKKNLPDIIVNYLSSTRFNLGKHKKNNDILNALHELHYGHISRYIYEISKSLDLDVNIHITNSDSLKTETISIDKIHYIIHDQYLGQSLNRMNRLYIYREPINASIIYAHKIASHVFSRYGFYNEAIFAARRYREKRDEIRKTSINTDPTNNKHLSFIHLQELLIFLHELGHIIFHERGDIFIDLTEMSKKWLADYARNEADNELIMKAIFNSHMTDIERKNIEMNLDEFMTDRVISSEYCHNFLNRDDLIEELCCDAFAILHLTPYLKCINISNAKAINIIILCFLHLRTLSRQDILCSNEVEKIFGHRTKNIDLNRHMYGTFYNARLHHAKQVCYDVIIKNFDEFKEVHSEISLMMDTHTDSILSPFENVTNTILYDDKTREIMADEFEYIENANVDNQGVMRQISAILHDI